MKFNPYPKYKDSGIQWIGEIPEGWEVRKLKYIGAITMGQSPDSNLINGEGAGIPFFQGKADFGKLYPEPKSWIKHPIKIAQKNDILITVRAPVGSLNIANQTCCIGRGIAAIKFQNYKYIYYVLHLVEKPLNIISSGSTFEAIGFNDLKTIDIPFCTNNQDQTAIANFLDSKTAKIDALIEKDKRLIELLKERRTALINYAVTKGLDPNAKLKDSGVEWIGEIPEGWEVRKLKHIALIRISNIDKKSKPNEEEVLLCNYNEVYNNESITSNLSFMNATATMEQINKFSIKKGDVIITKDSETPEDIAVPSLVEENLNNIVCGYHLALIKPNESKIKGEFLLRIFQSRKINDQFVISANGVTRFGISTYPIKNSFVIVPPLPDQTAIANFLDQSTAKIDKTIQKIKEKINLLQEYKKSLIHHVVTGKVDVRGVEV